MIKILQSNTSIQKVKVNQLLGQLSCLEIRFSINIIKIQLEGNIKQCKKNRFAYHFPVQNVFPVPPPNHTYTVAASFPTAVTVSVSKVDYLVH